MGAIPPLGVSHGLYFVDMRPGDTSAKLVQGNIASQLIRMALPMLLGISSMVIFNITDTFYIARLGTVPLAAISYTFPVILTVSSIAFGFGGAVMALVSQAIGQQDRQKVEQVTTHAFYIVLVVSILVNGIALFFIRPLFTQLGAAESELALVVEYMTIWHAGAWLVMMPMAMNNAIRATGDTLSPAIIMLVAAGVNVILDPLLIFGIGPFPRLETAGAAYATLISRGFTFAAALYFLAFRDKMLKCSLETLASLPQNLQAIFEVAIPSILSRVMVPIGIGIITRIIASYGSEAVAGYGLGSRFEFFAMAPVMALSSVLGPFLGQNFGAGKAHRMKRSVQISMGFTIVWTLVIAITIAAVAPNVLQWFTNDTAVVEKASLILRILPFSWPFAGVLLLCTTGLLVLKHPRISTLFILVEMFVLRIPLVLLAAAWWGYSMLFSGFVLSAALSATGACVALYVTIRRFGARTPSIR